MLEPAELSVTPVAEFAHVMTILLPADTSGRIVSIPTVTDSELVQPLLESVIVNTYDPARFTVGVELVCVPPTRPGPLQRKLIFAPEADCVASNWVVVTEHVSVLSGPAMIKGAVLSRATNTVSDAEQWFWVFVIVTVYIPSRLTTGLCNMKFVPSISGPSQVYSNGTPELLPEPSSFAVCMAQVINPSGPAFATGFTISCVTNT